MTHICLKLKFTVLKHTHTQFLQIDSLLMSQIKELNRNEAMVSQQFAKQNLMTSGKISVTLACYLALTKSQPS